MLRGRASVFTKSALHLMLEGLHQGFILCFSRSGCYILLQVNHIFVFLFLSCKQRSGLGQCSPIKSQTTYKLFAFCFFSFTVMYSTGSDKKTTKSDFVAFFTIMSLVYLWA